MNTDIHNTGCICGPAVSTALHVDALVFAGRAVATRRAVAAASVAAAPAAVRAVTSAAISTAASVGQRRPAALTLHSSESQKIST